MTFLDLSFLFSQNAMQRRLLKRWLEFVRNEGAFDECIRWFPVMAALHTEARAITEAACWEDR